MSASDLTARDWRSKIIEYLVNLYTDMPVSQLYGVEHALAVEEAVLASLAESEIDQNRSAELVVLRCAALLHDVGFADRDKAWSVDDIEHVDAGQKLAMEILRTIPALVSETDQVSRILVQ